jgi:hypothetical protein
MGLRDTAAADAIEIINDTIDGGDEIFITSPTGVSETFRALTNDIAISIDPETGLTVSGRQCSAVVATADLAAVGFDGITGVADADAKPWVVLATDVNGVQGTFKVAETRPDNTIGLLTLILEEYVPL